MITYHEDARRYASPEDELTDDEIMALAYSEADRADHDNQCEKDLEVE